VKVKIDTSELGQSRWQDYLLRFLFGGTVTALAGVIAKRFGPGIGGLFLAFPAILPAAATFGGAVVLSCATLAWLGISVALWQLRETLWRRVRVHVLNARLHTAARNKPSTTRRFDE
jgi:hypothetical protein